jgi:hypothetical protein
MTIIGAPSLDHIAGRPAYRDSVSAKMIRRAPEVNPKIARLQPALIDLRTGIEIAVARAGVRCPA